MAQPRRVPDALMYRYTSSGVIAHTVVKGHDAIRAFQRAGWLVLAHETEIRYSDLDDVRQLDIARLNNCKSAWKRSFGR